MFQKASVIYHARLNAAHFEREMVPLNAFYGFLNTLRNHCKRINEVVGQPSLGQFAEVIKSQFDWLIDLFYLIHLITGEVYFNRLFFTLLQPPGTIYASNRRVLEHSYEYSESVVGFVCSRAPLCKIRFVRELV